MGKISEKSVTKRNRNKRTPVAITGGSSTSSSAASSGSSGASLLTLANVWAKLQTFSSGINTTQIDFYQNATALLTAPNVGEVKANLDFRVGQDLYIENDVHVGGEIIGSVADFGWIKDSNGITLESRIQSATGFASLTAANTFTGNNTFNNDVILTYGAEVHANISLYDGAELGSDVLLFGWITDGNGVTLESRLQAIEDKNTFDSNVTFNNDVILNYGAEIHANLTLYDGAGISTDTIGFGWITDGNGDSISDFVGAGYAALDDDNVFTGENTFNDATYFNSGISFTGDSIDADVTGFAWLVDSLGVTLESRLAGSTSGFASLTLDNTFTGDNTFNAPIYVNNGMALDSNSTIDASVVGFAWLADSGGTTLESRLVALTPTGYPTLAGSNTFTGSNTFNTGTIAFNNGLSAVGATFSDEVVFTGSTTLMDAGVQISNGLQMWDDVIDMNSHKITNLSSGTLTTDAINLGQLNTAITDFVTETELNTAIADFVAIDDDVTITGSWNFNPSDSGRNTRFINSGIDIYDSTTIAFNLTIDELYFNGSYYIDFGGNGLNNVDYLQLTPTSSPSGVEGRIYYIKNKTGYDDGVYIYDGTIYQEIKVW